MIEELRHIFSDIRNSIIEMGVDVDECVSPEEYAERIKLINGNNAVSCIPVFKSSTEKPSTPTKVMSSNNPTDYPSGWSTPDGLTDDIWMTYTIVGPEKVYVPWTEPVLIYSTGEGGSQPRIEPGSTRVFLIYGEWPDRDVELDTPQGGHWDPELNILEKPITSIVRKNGTATGDIVYWDDNNNHQAGSFTWLSTGTFLASDGNLIGKWSDPVCINYAKDGKDGRNGVDGDNTEFIYKLFHNVEDVSRAETPYSDPDTDDYIPAGWSDQPNAIDPDVYPVEAMCTRKRNKTTGKWGEFIGPMPWAVWGQDGTDGDGIEYIFHVVSPDQCRQNEDGSWTLVDNTVFPPMNRDQYLAVTRLTGISDELALQAYQNDEFIPGDYSVPQSLGWDRNWTDDPSDVSANEPLEFVSIRKYRDEVWSWYSEPKLWNKWAYVDASIFTAFAFTRTNENLLTLSPALVIEGGSESNPIPDPSSYTKGGVQYTVTWYDSVPAGNGTVWMTQRVFGQPDTTWSSPSKMADTDRFQVEYSASILQDGASTQLPSLNNYITDANPEGVDETAWRNYCSSHNLGVWADDNSIVDPLWMATCNKVNGVWEDWHIARVRGENSIRIDFTNDKDELIYDHNGTKISRRNSTTTARLYDGASLASNVTWAISSVSGVYAGNGGTAVSEFPASPAANTVYIKTNGEVLLTGILANADSAIAMVEASYNDAHYYKQFEVGKKIGEDNYYLDFTPAAIVYNSTTSSPSQVNINVKVMKESYVDGSTSIASAMPSGYKVFLYDGNTVDVNWTDVNNTYTLNMNSNIQDLHLLLATAKTGGTIEDGPEDIPVTIVSNGTPGDDGRGIVSVTNYYMWYNSGTSHPAESASGWNTSIPVAPSDQTYKYLWKKIVTTYNNAPLTEITYELVSERGDRGPIGPKMRMRNWDYYTNPDGEGLDEWQCGDNATDSFYDIAIWPAVPDGISVDSAYAHTDNLWRCKANLKYANVPANANPSTLSDYFVQAVGWDFVATKLLLADKINANQIDVNGLSAKTIVTDVADGAYASVQGNTIELRKSGGITKCKISGNPITLSVNSSQTPVWDTQLGYHFVGGSFNQGISRTIDLGTFEITQDVGVQRDVLYSSENNILGIHFTGTVKSGVINTTHDIGVYGHIRLSAVNSNTGNYITWYQTNYGETSVIVPANTSLTPGDTNQYFIDSYTLQTNQSHQGEFAIGTYRLVLSVDLVDAGMSEYFENMYIYLNQDNNYPSNYGKFSAVINHHSTVTDLQYTDIGTDGFAHVLDADNYFNVQKESGNNYLTLEFLSGGQYGLKIDGTGIYKTTSGSSGWTQL